MRNRIVLLMMFLVGLAGFFLGQVRGKVASAQGELARCTVPIPREWGQYRGFSQRYGLAFEDQSGTIRFVASLPCGLGKPPVALELRRE